MKNFGRLDINDLEGEHISINYTDVSKVYDVEYKDDTLNFKDIKYVSLNSSGDGNVLINSLSNSSDVGFDKDGVFLNSNNNKYKNNPIAINSDYNNLKVGGNSFIVNSISSYTLNDIDSNVVFNIGKNNTLNCDYILGNDTFNTYYSTNRNYNYIFGNNVNEFVFFNNTFLFNSHSNSKIVKSNSLTIKNNDNVLTLDDTSMKVSDLYDSFNTNVSNSSFLYSGNDLDSSLFKYNGNNWICNNSSYVASSLFYDKVINNERLTFSGNNISPLNTYKSTHNSVILNGGDSKFTASNTIYLGVNEDDNFKLNKKLYDCTYINPYKDSKVKELSGGLFIGSGFKVTTSGLEVPGVNKITYKQMSILSRVDGYFNDVINGVYAKTGPTLNWNTYDYVQELEDSGLTNYFKIVATSQTSTNLYLDLKFTSDNYYYNLPLLDIIDLESNTYFRIVICNQEFYIDGASDYNIELYGRSVSQYGPRSKLALKFKDKNKKFAVKFSSYYLVETLGMEFMNSLDNLGTFTKIERKPLIAFNSYNVNKYPQSIDFVEMNVETLNANENITISDLTISGLNGYYKDAIDMYKLLGNGEPFTRDLNNSQKQNIERYGNNLDKFVKSSQKVEYIRNDNGAPSFTNYLDCMYINNFSRGINGDKYLESLNTYSFNNSIIDNYLPSWDSSFYGNASINKFVKWGSIASFCYRNDNIGKYTHFNDIYTLDDGNLTLYPFVPFIALDESTHQLIQPMAQEMLKIKARLKSNNQDFGVITLDFSRNNSICIDGSTYGFYPLLSLETDYMYNNYGFKGLLTIYNSNGKTINDFLGNSDKKSLETETLTYMTLLM